ncbi:hypothetical protein M2650_15035 [Luteimonas sp. SX5]|uniref:Uncharacterized protein n=1 Tax=Luteimonas galliterrae TaxID=2940486 RepID=A0ABT0MM27_9GAMM|nr:hypothetical protein [Luteimonas galliterrae]MCL1635936.1 hypothetical protein [Luteimonas galliterrae]
MRASPDPRSDNAGSDAARRGVRRTVLVLVVIAVAIYGAFILSGAMGQ